MFFGSRSFICGPNPTKFSQFNSNFGTKIVWKFQPNPCRNKKVASEPSFWGAQMATALYKKRVVRSSWNFSGIVFSPISNNLPSLVKIYQEIKNLEIPAMGPMARNFIGRFWSNFFISAPIRMKFSHYFGPKIRIKLWKFGRIRSTNKRTPAKKHVDK